MSPVFKPVKGESRSIRGFFLCRTKIIEVFKQLPKVIGYTILVRGPEMSAGWALMGSVIMTVNSTEFYLITNSSRALPLALPVYAG